MKLAKRKRGQRNHMPLIAIAIAVIGVLAIISATKEGGEAAEDWAKKFAAKFATIGGLAIGAAFAIRWLLVRFGLAAMLGTAAPMWLAAASVLVLTGAWNTAARAFGGPKVGDKYLPIGSSGVMVDAGAPCPPGTKASPLVVDGRRYCVPT
jgi:hypothetical protein